MTKEIENKEEKKYGQEKKDQNKKQGKKGNKGYKKDNYEKRFKSNSPAWYNKNPQLLKDAGSLSFNNPLGLNVEIVNPVYDTASDTQLAATKFPGIMRLGIVPTVGISKDGNSDVNNAMRQIYAFVRHVNSGSKNYEAPDYMTYLIACRSLYDYYAEMVRLYGLCTIYSHVNRFIAKGIVEALGYDYQDIVSNLSQLRYYINQFAIRCNTFATPKELTYYDRGAALPLNVYKDSSDDKAGLIVLQYDGYYRWTGTTYETGSACQFTSVQDQVTTFSDIVEFGDNLLTSMLTNEDIGIMSGDTLKSFGNDKLRQLVGIPETYSTIPVYDKDMLNQIHNTVFAGQIYSSASLDVKQESGNLICNPEFSCSDEPSILIGLPNLNPILDCDHNNPTPEEVMEYTRNMITFDQTAKDKVTIETCGSEIFTTLTIYTLSETGGVNSVSVDLVNYSNGIPTTGITPISLATIACFKGYFDWAPHIYVFGSLQGNDTVEAYPLGEIFNYTPIHGETLKKLHNAALLSLFNISGLGKAV